MKVWPLVVLLLAMACATDDGRRVRRGLAGDASPVASCEVINTPRVFLDDGQGRLFALPLLPRRASVEVSQAHFELAMARLAAGLSTPLRPLLPRLTLSWAPPLSNGEQAALVSEYQSWCTRRPGDCLSSPEEGLSLGPDEKVDMALSFAVDGVWAGAHSAVQGILDPAQLYNAVISSLTAYLTLLVLPEPVSKAIVITLTAWMVAYLGMDTVKSLLDGWRQMRADALRARSFAQLRAAGERFGALIGTQTARVLVMLTTMALGSTSHAAMMRPPGPGLPALAELEAGASFLVLLRARAIALSEAGIIASFAPNALATVSTGDGGGSRYDEEASQAAVPRENKHRIQSVESWRKPRFTEDGRIVPYKGSRSPPEPITNLGRNRAGQSVTDGQRTIRFDENGFPEFKTKFETLLDDIHIGSRSRPGHYRAANQKLLQAIEEDPSLARELGLSRSSIEGLGTSVRAPDGYAWHHHQDVGRMQLVPDGDHLLANSHTGGMAIWGGGR
ncbi:MAG TPA: HNH endonuclease [Archangium sp.]|uniref:SitA5 family polymorphic toxin n=1 Tax=Archangium sp. TaxID=1872627 RepID=UPI002E338D61|nr:HNH endonuclease [Archangium sp.]HEX5754335.1 HNH endonuclease [Archangium sp.]